MNTNSLLAQLHVRIVTVMEVGSWRDNEDVHFRRWFDGHPDNEAYDGLSAPQQVSDRLRSALALLNDVDIGFAHQLGNALRLRVVFPNDFVDSSVNVLLDIMDELGWEQAEAAFGVERWLGHNMRSGRPLHMHAYMPLPILGAYGLEVADANELLTLEPIN